MIVAFIQINEPSQTFQKIIFSSLIIFTLILGKFHFYQIEITVSSNESPIVVRYNNPPFLTYSHQIMGTLSIKFLAKHLLGFY